MNKLKQVIKEKIKYAQKNVQKHEDKLFEKLQEFNELSGLNELDLEMMNKLHISVSMGKYALLALPPQWTLRKDDKKYYLFPVLQGVPVDPEDYPDAINALEEYLSGIEVGNL